MLKVLVLILGYWRFLLLFLDVEGFCFWMLKVCDFWSFVYLHMFKKMMWKYIPFYLEVINLVLFSLIYNDKRFMKGDFLMIIMLHMSCFVLKMCDDFCCFYVIGLNFHYVSIHQNQKYVYKVRFFQKYLKL